jgi:Nucleotidyltransferase of unknown function (DUF6036)
MDLRRLRQYLADLDSRLPERAQLCIYGSAAFMLLGEEDRFSLDIDVAAPYSSVNEQALALTAEEIGLPLNPSEDFPGDHIEWIGPARLCLAAVAPENRVFLWRGSHLDVFTVALADLAASKLIRYDPLDQADIQFLMLHGKLSCDDIAQAVERLPLPFRNDVLVRENLSKLRGDASRWLS